MSKKIDRVGEYFITNEGYKIVIVEYNNNKDITVEFQDDNVPNESDMIRKYELVKRELPHVKVTR